MPTPAGTPGAGNAGLLAAAQQAAGTAASGKTVAPPVSDISQVPAGSPIYAGGNTFSSGTSRAYSLSHKNPEFGPNAGPAQAPVVAGSTSAKQTQSVEQWLKYFYTNIANNPDSLRQFVSEAALAGMTNTNASQEQAYSAWQKLVTQSYNHTISGQQVTPWDVLANSIPVDPSGVGTSKGGGGAGSFANNSGQKYLQGLTNAQVNSMVQDASNQAAENSKKNTVTTVDINYTDPDTARYILNQTYQQYLGRAPTNKEIAAFTTTLNSNEKNFPKKSTSVFTPTPGTTNDGTANSTVPVPESGSTGTTVVGYDSSGNPIMGPSNTVGTTGSAPGTETTTELGEADYTRYGRQQLAIDTAQSDPHYGAYQAAGPLFQAFLGALAPAVKGVGSNG